MTDTATARFALALLQPGQAQKEMFHNEAIAAIDLIVQASVVAVGTNTPPSDAAIGQCWIVGAAPTGAWSGKAKRLAGWTDGGWRFVDPVEGMAIWSTADALLARFVGGDWALGQATAASLTIAGHQVVGAQVAAIASPTGGATIDAESRATLTAVLVALRAHGLIAS